jgi:Asp-tRNA(Asn)/Glu-tRNA(Gln) amidotransferase A subunit family amidase
LTSESISDPAVFLSPASADEALCFAPLDVVSGALAAGEVSAQELATLFLNRIDRLDGELNAFVTVTADLAMAAARASDERRSRGETIGVLDGVPVALKDNEPMAGVRHTMGLKPLSANVAAVDALHVQRLRDAGATILGKTNTPEMAHKATTDNLLCGPTRNPHSPSFNAGGSSGGSAAAVAAGLTVVAQGSDGGGSIRIPAAMCGVVGYKPSAFVIPDTGRPNAFGSTVPFLHIGPIARTVDDAATVARILARPTSRDPFSVPFIDPGTSTGARIAFDPVFGDFPVDEDVLDKTTRALERVATLSGVAVDARRVDLPPHEELAALWLRQVSIIYATEAEDLASSGADLRGTLADQVPPELHALFELGARQSAVEQRRDGVLRTRVFDAIEDVLEDFDLIATPTLAIDGLANSDDGCTVGPSIVASRPVDPTIGWCLTYPVNFSGHPAISVPIGTSARGLPLGLQLIGRRWHESQLLAVATTIAREFAA